MLYRMHKQEDSTRWGVFRCIKFQIKCWEPHTDTPLIHRRCVANVKQRWDAVASDPRKWDSAACRSFGDAERIRSYTCTHSHLLYLSDIWVYSWLTAPTVLHPQLLPLPSSAPHFHQLESFIQQSATILQTCAVCWCSLSGLSASKRQADVWESIHSSWFAALQVC